MRNDSTAQVMGLLSGIFHDCQHALQIHQLKQEIHDLEAVIEEQKALIPQWEKQNEIITDILIPQYNKMLSELSVGAERQVARQKLVKSEARHRYNATAIKEAKEIIKSTREKIDNLNKDLSTLQNSDVGQEAEETMHTLNMHK